MNVLILIILEYIYIQKRTSPLPGCTCLNPYYTGIHLHSAVTKKFRHFLSLNPYYTGIHLHKTVKWNI